MTMNKAALFPLFFLLVIILVAPVHAATSFDIMEVPTYIDEQFGCGEFVGGLLASLVLLSLILLPLMYLTKGKAYGIYIVFGLLVLAPLVGLGWLPVWLYIIIILALAIGFGRKLAEVLGGLRG